MGKTIGIDLGTTNTCVAVLKDGRPNVLKDEKGYKVLPSVVSMKGEGRYVVGQQAKNLILTAPGKTVYAAKRLMGRRADSPEAARVRERMAYTIEAGPDGLCQVVLGDMIMTPVEISSIVLRMAKQIAERTLGEEVTEAVITVPAYFNHGQRAATMEAAQLAGLRCERILNEPTAAALAYGYRKDIEKTILIFDLGGGTFDVSLLHMSHGVYEILSTTGDTFLGGEDFDFKIVDWLADRYQRKHGKDLREDKVVVQRLKDAAERAKCELSFMDKTAILIPQIQPGINLEETLTRTQLEQLTEDLVDRSLEISRNAIQAAGLQISDIDDVILVGGQTRMPRVRELITNLFGKEPSRSVHPEEVVAIGAAVHAESLDDPEKPAALLIDVTPFDLGIDTAGGYFSSIIERNSKIPTYHTRTFTTVSDNQDQVKITVRQGESSNARDNEFLGEFVLTGLRPAPRMSPKLDVTFRIDGNGMLHVTAAERATGERQQIVIRNYAESASSPTAGESGHGEGNGVAAGAAAGAAAAAGEKGARKLLSRLFGKKDKKGKKDGKDEVAAAAAAPPDASADVYMPETVEPAAAAPAPMHEPDELPVEAMQPLADDPLGGDDLFAMPDGEEHAAFSKQPAAAEVEDDPFAMPDDLGLGDDLFSMPADDEPEPAAADDLGMGDDMFAMPADDDGGDEDDMFAMPADDAGGDDLFGEDLFDFGDDAPPAPAPAPAAAPPAPADDFGDLGDFGLGDEPGDEGDLLAAAGALMDEMAGADDGLEPPDEDDPFASLGDMGDDPFAELGGAEPFADEAAADDPFASAPADAASPPSDDPFASLGDDLFAEPAPEPPPRAAAPPEAAPPRPAPPAAAPPKAAPPRPVPPRPTPPEPVDLEPEPLDLEPEPLDLEPEPEPPRSAPAEVSRAASRPAPVSAADDRRRKRKKPARLKIAYRKASAFAKEYRRNLDQNGAFIKTGKPLPIDREVVFQISVPGLESPLVFGGKVISTSDGSSGAPGMQIEYTLSGDERNRLESAVRRMGR
jgi:molecular chaperone DnaK